MVLTFTLSIQGVISYSYLLLAGNDNAYETTFVCAKLKKDLVDIFCHCTRAILIVFVKLVYLTMTYNGNGVNN